MNAVDYIYANKWYFRTVIRKWTKNSYLIDEIFQEFAIRAHQYPRDNMTKSYLAQMADWEALSYLRPRARAIPVKFLNTWDIAVPHYDQIEEKIELEQKMQAVIAVIKTMKPKSKKVMNALLKYRDDDVEVYKKIKMNRGAGATLKKHAIIKIRKKLNIGGTNEQETDTI